MTQQFYFRVYAQKIGRQGLQEVFVHSHSHQHYSQQPEGGNSPNVHQQVND